MTDEPIAPLRILAIHRYFWPDTAPYGVILRAIARRWAADGHDVTVLSTQPSYRTGAEIPRRPPMENDDGVRVRRIRLPREQGRGILVRLLNMVLWMGAIVFQAIRNGRFDIIMVATVPPVLAAAAARYAARMTGARLIYHCMDIHPEIGRISGEFRNPRLYKLLLGIDSANCRGADLVVVLSDDMRCALQSRPSVDNTTILVINNFNAGDKDAVSADNILPEKSDDRRQRIIFAGNLGRFQGLETVVDALLMLDEEVEYEMYFVGGGLLRDSLVGSIGDHNGKRIRFIPYQPPEVVRRMIRDSDFGLVSLAPDISRYAYPSKTMTYLGEGRPLLACVEPESSLAELIRREEIGIVVPPADPAALAAAITSLASEPERCERYKNRAEEIGARLFDERRTLDQWSGLLARL